MARKAEWKGCCQACGRLQMLPSGVLSDHGYEISHGWRNGVCYGAGHLPIEESCDLIQSSADGARAQAARLMQEAVAARAIPLGELKCWSKVYHPELSNRSRGSVRLWEEGSVLGDGYGAKFIVASSGRPASDGFHSFKSGAEIAHECRAKYAAGLEFRAAAHNEYAEKQEKVLAAWAPKPLIPRGKNE